MTASDRSNKGGVTSLGYTNPSAEDLRVEFIGCGPDVVSRVLYEAEELQAQLQVYK